MKLLLLSASIFIMSIHCSVAQIDVQNEGQSGKWQIAVGGGVTFPIGPDEFAGQWEQGYGLRCEALYSLADDFAIGGFIEQSGFFHTGRSLKYADDDFRCIQGGNRIFTSFGLEGRAYHISVGSHRLYSSWKVGVLQNYRSNAVFGWGNYEYTVGSNAEFNEMFQVGVGFEVMFSNTVGITVEGGCAITHDGFALNWYVPVVGSAMVRF